MENERSGLEICLQHKDFRVADGAFVRQNEPVKIS